MEGCAKKIVAKCKEKRCHPDRRLRLPIPYGKDPKDSNIRIAPSFPNLEELAQATDLFVLCVKLVSIEKYWKPNKRGGLVTTIAPSANRQDNNSKQGSGTSTQSPVSYILRFIFMA